MNTYSFSKFNSILKNHYEGECLLFEQLWKLYLAFRYDLYENNRILDAKYRVYENHKYELLQDGHCEMDAIFFSSRILSNHHHLMYDNQKIQGDMDFLSGMIHKHYDRLVTFLGFCYFEHSQSNKLNNDIFHHIKGYLIDDNYESTIQATAYNKSDAQIIKAFKLRIPQSLKLFWKTIEQDSVSNIVNLTYGYEDMIGFYPVIFPTIENMNCIFINFIHDYF